MLHRTGTGTDIGLSCPAGTVFNERQIRGDTGSGLVDGYVCKDVLGREIRAASRAFDGGWNSQGVRSCNVHLKSE